MASTDTLEDNRGFASKNDASFPILSDTGKTMSAAYGVLSERGFAKRWTFYIDPDGIVRKIDKQVNPASAGTDLVSNLKTLNVPAAD